MFIIQESPLIIANILTWNKINKWSSKELLIAVFLSIDLDSKLLNPVFTNNFHNNAPLCNVASFLLNFILLSLLSNVANPSKLFKTILFAAYFILFGVENIFQINIWTFNNLTPIVGDSIFIILSGIYILSTSIKRNNIENDSTTVKFILVLIILKSINFIYNTFENKEIISIAGFNSFHVLDQLFDYTEAIGYMIISYVLYKHDH